jgi:hypothetical protein
LQHSFALLLGFALGQQLKPELPSLSPPWLRNP